MLKMFHDEFARLAAACGLKTQQEIATACGLSQSFVSRLLKGESVRVNAETLYAISRALGVDCRHWEKFFGEPTPPSVKPKKRGK